MDGMSHMKTIRRLCLHSASHRTHTRYPVFLSSFSPQDDQQVLQSADVIRTSAALQDKHMKLRGSGNGVPPDVLPRTSHWVIFRGLEICTMSIVFST